MAASKQEEEHQVMIPDWLKADRADKVLARTCPQFSRSRWQKLFKEGRVWEDDRILMPKNRIGPGMLVEYTLPSLQPLELRPVKMDLTVLFEDEDMLVLDKEAGQVVHPGAGTGEDTLVHGLLYHCQGSLSGIGGTERPGIVHRLDKETSGVLLIAKSDRALQGLSEQFVNRTITKRYIALVMGRPEVEMGIICEPISRHPVHRTRMRVDPRGRFAKTDFKVLKPWGTIASLVELYIHTGRTHQIRVHMKHLGHPLLGDPAYGFKEGRLASQMNGEKIKIPRVMLHASRIGFQHPVSHEQMELEAPLPEDFLHVMDSLDPFTG